MHRCATALLLFVLPAQAHEHPREFADNNGTWFDNLERPDNEQHPERFGGSGSHLCCTDKDAKSSHPRSLLPPPDALFIIKEEENDGRIRLQCLSSSNPPVSAPGSTRAARTKPFTARQVRHRPPHLRNRGGPEHLPLVLVVCRSGSDDASA